ncbi:MAG: hypothetical protein GY720_15785 [bacterium]|nr:hypothetical protein [bacterium]
MTPEQEKAIRAHGEDLQRIFPAAAGDDPLTLCKRLRRVETEAHHDATQNCNVGMPEGWRDRHEGRAQRLLGDTEGRIWVNGDARGYALKMDLREGERLATDWGGYGLIAPEIGPEGN